MAWIWTVLIALWGLPLFVIAVVGLACLVSERLRLAASRILGLTTGAPTARQTRSTVAPARMTRADRS